MEQKTYIAAPKRSSRELVTADWKERISAIKGVSVLGSTRNQTQFRADVETAQKVSNELGADFTIEETREREPYTSG